MACKGTTSRLPLKKTYPHTLTVVIARSKAYRPKIIIMDSKSTRAFLCVCVFVCVCVCHFPWCCPVQVHSLRPVEHSCKHSYYMCTNKSEMPKKTEVLAFFRVLGKLVPFPSLTPSFCKITFNVILSYILVHGLLQDANISTSIECSLCSLLLFVGMKILFKLPNQT
jgi:hypothetical protein